MDAFKKLSPLNLQVFENLNSLVKFDLPSNVWAYTLSTITYDVPILEAASGPHEEEALFREVGDR
jgi:hypothetical protein